MMAVGTISSVDISMQEGSRWDTGEVAHMCEEVNEKVKRGVVDMVCLDIQTRKMLDLALVEQRVKG